jgi:hypothetical protein
MDDKEKEELSLRRKAIRLSLKGWRPSDILKYIPRSRGWLFKWQKRFEAGSWENLKSKARRPQQSPQAYDKKAHKIVIKVRLSMAKRRVGLIAAEAVEQEISRHRLLNPVPAVATIKRWLKKAGLLKSEIAQPAKVYYPEPNFSSEYVFHALDWTARYLEGGMKVFIFHTIDTQTRALIQTISSDKATSSIHFHALEVWNKLGLPDFLQLDNDAAFNGGERTARRFGFFVRLALYLGIELIFIPPREPKRNWLVEGINGLWAKSFWKRDRFNSLAEVVRKSHKFTDWYENTYRPPALDGLTPNQAQRGLERFYLTKRQIRQLPKQLPITAGRIHFIRRVSPDGEISFLGESWKVSKRLAHQYTWATIITHCRRLEIYHRLSERSKVCLIKTFHYSIQESVHRLSIEYQRDYRRRPMLEML